MQDSPADIAAVEAGLRVIVPLGQVFEIRILDGTTREDRRAYTYSGYFEDPAKAAKALAPFTIFKGAYVVLNPINPALLARSMNKIRIVGREPTTADGDILSRIFLPIDLDAKRPSGISASDDEHRVALEKALQVRDYLLQCGWPMPLMASSGNGAHLLHKIDLPVDDGGLVQRCLQALAKRFDDDRVSIDQAVFNPSRIWKLYGTIAGKGDPEGAAIGRPQRRSKIIEVPKPWETINRELLESLGLPATGQPKASNGHHGNGAFDIDSYLARSGLELRGPEPYQGGRKWIFATCPWNDQHTGGSAFVIQRANGLLQAGCHHNGCSGHDWHSLREILQPGWRERRNSSQHRDYPPRDESESRFDDESPADDPAPPKSATDSLKIEYQRFTCAELDRAEFQIEYIVQNTVVGKEPLVIAGAKRRSKRRSCWT